MIPNGVKAIWKDGKVAINGFLSTASAFAAEVMASQSFDALTVDLQHGLVDPQSAIGIFQAMRGSGVTPLARVASLDAAQITKVLDAGAYGVICPLVNTRRQAEELVSYMRYPPNGVRSYGPTRANYSAGADYGAAADGELICFAMIETREGYDNLETIVATPGLDAVYVGPVDLTLSLRGRELPIGLDREEPDMVEAIQRILHVSHGAGIRAGIQCGTAAYAAKAAGWGFDLVTLSTDIAMLAATASASVAEARNLISELSPPHKQ